MSTFRFIDLFSGIGGFRKPLETYGGECVFSCENNKHSRQTYAANYATNQHPFPEDIRDVEEKDIPSHDFLVAAFPSQSFSAVGVGIYNHLGRKHGFGDEDQGNLFFDIVRILKYHRPRVFLLENVRGITSHDNGQTFAIIKNTLEKDLGYSISYRLINANRFLPQNRERIFILGFLEQPLLDINNLPLPLTTNGPTLSAILHPEDGSEPSDPQFTAESGKVLDQFTLSDDSWQRLQDRKARHSAKGKRFGYNVYTPEDVSCTLIAHYAKQRGDILIEQQGRNPRVLTPRECSRLMGFDEPRCSDFVIPVPNTHAYRQFGNAVAVPVVRAITNYIMPCFDPYYASEYFYSPDAPENIQPRLL